ncbi:uncharacterized protein F4812DRAFT_465959 [Daldinia caldariorum]|uniref:uncharacterized protein n=1 Tax=Daldinia caldariorum TaxID=326644 RepID=UPI0020081889|nr:uncharacterized protein F4812DRAFT_465959 [Daldinia caldariorum]KAI1466053.1 hypothetical protein F4812DRAFT_465959 [Daldinia caldariorum]
MDVTSLLNSSPSVQGKTSLDKDVRNIVSHGAGLTSATAAEVTTRYRFSSDNFLQNNPPISIRHETTIPYRQKDQTWNSNEFALPPTVEVPLAEVVGGPTYITTSSPVVSVSLELPPQESYESISSLPLPDDSSLSFLSRIPFSMPGIPFNPSPSQLEWAEFVMPKTSPLGVQQETANEAIISPPWTNGKELGTDPVRSSSPSDFILARSLKRLDWTDRRDVTM